MLSGLKLPALEADRLQARRPAAHQYAINEITHYEAWFNAEEKIFWDFWSNAWRVNGEDQNATTNAVLRIPRTG